MRCFGTLIWYGLDVESYADPGGGEPPPTPTSPVCDSAFSEHHGCWPCDHRDHSECEASHSHSHSQPTHSQPSSGRSSPRWDDDEEDDRHHHVLTQGLGHTPTSHFSHTELSLKLFDMDQSDYQLNHRGIALTTVYAFNV